MTKALEDELNLPRLEDALKELAEGQEDDEAPSSSPEVTRMANALAAASPVAIATATDPMGVQEHTMEADDIYEQAIKAHKDLMDLGFNVEPKHAGANAFTPAMKALEIALKASQSKSARKMDQIRLVMEREKHLRDMNEGVEDGEIIEGSGGQSITANRNDLMDKIRKGEF